MNSQYVEEIVNAHVGAAWAMASAALAHNGEMRPLAVVMNIEENQINLVPGQGDKEQANSLIRHVVTVTQSDFVLMIAEASMLELKNGEDVPDHSLHSDPRSRDVVVLRYRVKGSPSQMIARAVNRTASGMELGEVLVQPNGLNGMDVLLDDIFERQETLDVNQVHRAPFSGVTLH